VRTKAITRVAAAAAVAAAAFALTPWLAGHGTPAPGTTDTAAHAMPSSLVACERSHRVCHRAALARYPLVRPMPRGAGLLTRQQVAGRPGWSGDTVRARLMTYGQAAAAYPALAASAVIARSREVWVVTVYYPRPVTMPFAGGYGPPGEPATEQVSAVSEVIDAATGTVTDSCEGCAVIPR
jgi:hypothetical protein